MMVSAGVGHTQGVNLDERPHLDHPLHMLRKVRAPLACSNQLSETKASLLTDSMLNPCQRGHLCLHGDSAVQALARRPVRPRLHGG